MTRAEQTAARFRLAVANIGMVRSTLVIGSFHLAGSITGEFTCFPVGDFPAVWGLMALYTLYRDDLETIEED